MAHTVPRHEGVEMGKERILEELIEALMSGGLDLKSLALTWQHDPGHHSWVLAVRQGKEQHALKVVESDVVGWPHNPEISLKYGDRIRKTIRDLQAAETRVPA
jgi:hypothetical protein